MDRKGQGLPLNTIIIAIIVLVVLVVLVAIFVGQIGGFEEDLDTEANLRAISLRASSSYDCVPNNAAVAAAVRDAAGTDSKLSPDEESSYEANVGVKVNKCRNLIEEACNADGECQWK
jgi:hypothetical protein